MKMNASFLRWRCAFLTAILLLVGSPVLFAQLALETPTITAIRVDGTDVVVEAQIPAGLRRVTLECRERMGTGAWEPRAVVRSDGAGGRISVRLERSRALELVRVRADASEPLPLAFYGGTNAGQTAPREVVESDIWRIRGQTVYFFNQMRGLQVIDVSNPDAATVTGQLA